MHSQNLNMHKISRKLILLVINVKVIKIIIILKFLVISITNGANIIGIINYYYCKLLIISIINLIKPISKLTTEKSEI